MICDKCNSPFELDASSSPHRENIAGLEEEIASIDNMVEMLAQRRLFLRSKINTLSPTALLPPEILIHIFRITCQDEERAIPPLFFGSICKEWRELAWSAPLLWNTVSLRVSPRTNVSQVQLLGDWLSRANTAPLFIKLTSADENKAIFCALQSIMDVLVTRSMYWYSFDCVLPPHCPDILTKSHFPMLTSVSIKSPKGCISAFTESPNMFLSAPKLLDVALRGYSFPSMVLPWEQLRRFKTFFLTVAECLEVIRRASNLKECHLEWVYIPENASLPISDTQRSELEKLDMMLYKGGSYLFGGVTLPCLRELRVESNFGDDGGILLPAISSLVLRSGCNLQRLYIQLREFSADDLISCLETIPSLTHLSLKMAPCPLTGFTDRLVSALDPSRHPRVLLLPSLKSLEYRGPILCAMRTLLDMLTNRWRSAISNTDMPHFASLSSVEIIYSEDLEILSEDCLRIARLRTEGMLLIVQRSDDPAGSHRCKLSLL